MKTFEPSPRPHSRRLGPIAVLALALGVLSGCGREFYRQWANQDASEAVFEKSRDPRFRLDMFSIDPPSMARHADPYDPDVPPAPPDDHTTEALAPAPQWPGNRLLVPVEGTGYLDMLDNWARQTPYPERNKPVPAAAQPTTLPPPLPPPEASTPPFQALPNSGTNPSGTSPSSLPGPQPAIPGGSGANPPQALLPKRDLGTRLAAFQETGLPPPVPAGEQPSRLSRELSREPAVDLQTPAVGMDPNPINSDLSAPFNPRPDLSPDQYRASEAMGAEMAGILVPGEIDFNEAEAAGYPANSRPYRLTFEQAFTLALINSRFYQYNLEQVYIAALNVTLQRFAFTPQFFAGLTPTQSAPSVTPNGTIVGFSPVPINQFLYRTRETGSPTSALNMGTVVGVGKVFNSGAQLVAGFANQIVFNFIGKNSSQPTVQSFLPLSIVQPFLRGGGRAVTLEPLTQAERNLVYQVRSFAQFRQQFLVTVLVGGSVQVFGALVGTAGFSAGITGNIDPIIGFINVLQDLQEIENDRKNIAAFEQLFKVYRELIQGESSGLSQLQLDQVDSNLQGARAALVADKYTYRNDLDQFKIQMGLPPDVPLVLDRRLTAKFGKTFNDLDEWQRNPRRDMTDLPKIASQLPQLEDVILDGHSVLGVFGYHQQKGAKKGDVSEYVNNEDTLESLMKAAERTALERRLDVMNSRAGLYDSWRQLRVTANALRGVLNLSLTNQFLTPPTTTNPFAFLEQAKQFSLVINAQLPLVRLAERNAFRTALINYQRARRTLMNVEDFTKFQVRQDIRNMQTQYLTYEINRRNLVLTVRQKDQAFEQIIAPPAGAASATQAAQAAVQTTNLINFQSGLLTRENTLVMSWLTFQIARLQLYRDLGIMPYDEWEAFHVLFPEEPVNRDELATDTGPARGPAAAPAEVIRR
jgi:hypothetical protein